MILALKGIPHLAGFTSNGCTVHIHYSSHTNYIPTTASRHYIPFTYSQQKCLGIDVILLKRNSRERVLSAIE